MKVKTFLLALVIVFFLASVWQACLSMICEGILSMNLHGFFGSIPYVLISGRRPRTCIRTPASSPRVVPKFRFWFQAGFVRKYRELTC